MLTYTGNENRSKVHVKPLRFRGWLLLQHNLAYRNKYNDLIDSSVFLLRLRKFVSNASLQVNANVSHVLIIGSYTHGSWNPGLNLSLFLLIVRANITNRVVKCKWQTLKVKGQNNFPTVLFQKWENSDILKIRDYLGVHK